MENLQQLAGTMMWLTPLITFLILWDGIWKLIALWRAGRNNHLAWFICIGIFNTVGILPIIYLLIYRKKSADNQ